MEESEGLAGAVVDRHPCDQVVVAELEELDAEVADQAPGGELVGGGEGGNVAPDVPAGLGGAGGGLVRPCCGGHAPSLRSSDGWCQAGKHLTCRGWADVRSPRVAGGTCSVCWRRTGVWDPTCSPTSSRLRRTPEPAARWPSTSGRPPLHRRRRSARPWRDELERIAAACSIDPGPVPGEARSRRPGRRSHFGCPRWSCGSHLARVTRASLILIDPLPPYVWFQDVVDFAEGVRDFEPRLRTCAGRSQTQVAGGTSPNSVSRTGDTMMELSMAARRGRRCRGRGRW